MDRSDLIQEREANALPPEANSKSICCRDEANAEDDRENDAHDLERSPTQSLRGRPHTFLPSTQMRADGNEGVFPSAPLLLIRMPGFREDEPNQGFFFFPTQ